jgi:hypothetical protein
MDLKQRKLSKSEWESIEISVSPAEIEILKLIVNGYNDVNIKSNKTSSLFSFLKIEYSEKMENYLYNKYFSERINEMLTLYKIDVNINVDSKVTIKKADQIRLLKNDSLIENKEEIYEIILIKQMDSLFLYKEKKDRKWMYHYFILYKLIRNNIFQLNQHVKQIVSLILEKYNEIDISHIICNANEYIEKNSYLLKYGDMTLYDHQKEIFTASKIVSPKLILYIAPTGTGKTMTPLGLSEQHKIIFVCAARHVGLALARSAISINKKVAFAFGCSSAEDVRLHYFSAKEFSVNKRSGGIGKVDNTIGDKVEIMICDIKSYLCAMYYMLAFNDASTIITYWDEPTITLDYDNHEFHSIIKKNWTDNLIPNFVLSSATLPKIHEITNTITDFKEKFPDAMITNIVSHDCRKTIPIINNCGYVIMPHYLSRDYDKILEIANHCENNLTLLRYFDLQESSLFIDFCEKNNYIKSSAKLLRNFASIDDIDMKSIKMHYLKVIKNIILGTWGAVYTSFKIFRKRRIGTNSTIDLKGQKIKKTQSIGPGITSGSHSGEPLSRLKSEQIIKMDPIPVEDSGVCAMYITTKDAYTLTDGPAIFLATDVHKIAKFCIQQANIPSVVMTDIIEKIEYNNNINEKINEIEKEMETEIEKRANKEEKNDGMKKSNKKEKSDKTDKIGKIKDTKIIQLQDQINMCRSMIKHASLNEVFIPNKLAHIDKWADGLHTKSSFTSNIDDDTIVSIMLLKDVEDSWKILLLLGIGVFTTHESIAYTEIMKKLADQQKLYMIIADSDYIYGTNYQFCHGYLSKDLKLTQEKIIQAMGRIGRNNIQQEYSVRFRDDEQIKTLFTSFQPEDKPEVINMNLLFNSKNVKWNPETKKFDL